MKIRCNSVHPGVIRTRMLENAYEQFGKAANISKEEAEEASLAHVPFRHVGEPDDVAFDPLPGVRRGEVRHRHRDGHRRRLGRWLSFAGRGSDGMGFRNRT